MGIVASSHVTATGAVILNDPMEALTNWSPTSGCSIVAGRNANGLQLIGSNTPAYTIPAGPLQSTSMTVQFSYKISDLTAFRNVFQFRTAAGVANHLTMRVNTNGSVTLYNGGITGNVLGTGSTGMIVVGTWYTFKLVAVMTSSGSAVFSVNGTPQVSVSGVDCSGGNASATDTLVLMGPGAGPTSIFDDFLATTP